MHWHVPKIHPILHMAMGQPSAYVGNWQQCPTDDQVDAYSHIVIAFAVSYTWTPEQNNCNQQCQVPSSLPTCENQARPDLIQKWRNMGKKVIVSFGGAGMGGSWPGKLTLYLYYSTLTLLSSLPLSFLTKDSDSIHR